MQVMRPRPHVDGDQRPEVDHRQPVGVDRALRLLRHEVVHHAEEAGRQEEADGVVAVPPLHHRIDGARIDLVGLGQRDRYREVVEDVQDSDRDDEGAVEPVGHIDVLDASPRDRHEEHDRKCHPDHGNQQVDRPFQLCIFLGLGNAERQGNGGEHDDDLPAPERERSQLVERETHVTGALHDIVCRREQRGAAESKDHCVGVQRAKPAVGQERQVEIELRPDKLRGDEYAGQHSDHAPYDCHDRKLAYNRVVVLSFSVQRTTPVADCKSTGSGALERPGTAEMPRPFSIFAAPEGASISPESVGTLSTAPGSPHK